MEPWRLKMEPWRACKPVVADSHDFDEEQDPNPHQSEKPDLDPEPHRSKITKRWIRICITLFRICNTAHKSGRRAEKRS
jgi:hypothetical protein